VVPPDTSAATDTSKVGQVADVIHDSVKAQIKSPIVQVPVTLKSLILPGVLFAYGAVTLNNGGLRGANEQARDWIWDGNHYASPYLEDYMLLVPAAAVYGMNIFGLKGQNNLIDRSVIYGMSNLIANGIIFGLKGVGIETRPDTTDNHSFPSGHTAEAFVSAEFLHQEYKNRIHWTVVAAGYGVAISVAYLRMAHNKHWLGDVVAGAGVGIASTRFAYYLYPIIKHKLFGSKKVKEDAMIMPTYRDGMYGLGLVYRF
jgi:membrane-associated phospholipid phosphatase